MAKFKVDGVVKITYTYYIVNETIEGDDEEDALDGLIETCEPTDAFDTDIDFYSLKVEEIEEAEETEAKRMIAMGASMLPGFA
jgi:hypothetical protein